MIVYSWGGNPFGFPYLKYILGVLKLLIWTDENSGT